MALTARQKAFIDAYIENPIIPMNEYARRMNIPAQTIYNWKSNNSNGFADELEIRLKRKWEEAKFMATDGMLSLAREGNFQALKYILDYSGYQPAQKQEVQVESNSINIKIGD